MSAPKSPGDSAMNTCEYVYLSECMEKVPAEISSAFQQFDPGGE